MHFKGKSRKKWVGIVVGALLGVGVGIYCNDYSGGGGLREASYDLLLVARGELPAREAVLVYLDEISHQTLDQPLNLPWDRSIHAQLIDRLTELGARAIVFDIVFSDPSIRGPKVDQQFANSIKTSGRVILAADNVPIGFKQRRIDPPIDLLMTNAAATGTADVIPSSDLIVRRHTPSDPDYFPSLAIATAQFVGAEPIRNPERRQEERWMNYYGRPNLLPSMSYYEVFLQENRETDFFRGKVVFVGARIQTRFAGERKDEYPNPFSFWNKADEGEASLFMSGVEIQAVAFLNLLRGDWLTKTSFHTQLTLVLLLGLAFGAGLLLLRPWPATGVALLGTALLCGISYFQFKHDLIWFPWLIVAVQIAVALVWAIVYNSIQLYVEKRLLEQTLALYLSPKLIKKFARDDKWLRPGAERQTLTILFSDIANFTDFSEGLNPDTLSNFINGYFEDAVNECIHPTDGTVVKYLGDSIFAFWNAPEEQADHAIRACTAAVKFHKKGVYEINGRPVLTRIGLHTGEANVGNFGSTQRVDYTAFGESINLASRMEGLNKHLGTALLITGETLAQTGDQFTTRFLGRFRLKGFEKPVAVHELIGAQDEDEPTRPWRNAFSEALDRYKKKDFDAAESGFQKVLELHPDDGPARFYLDRIAHWRANPVALADARTEETQITEK